MCLCVYGLIVCDALGPEVGGEVELVGLEVVAVEEYDCFGCGIVDADYSCGLRQGTSTSLMERRYGGPPD